MNINVFLKRFYPKLKFLHDEIDELKAETDRVLSAPDSPGRNRMLNALRKKLDTVNKKIDSVVKKMDKLKED